MILTGKALPRRFVLKGLGATLALPLLDAMVPALSRRASAAVRPFPRLGVAYVPNGIVSNSWIPTTTGSDFLLPPTLEPLAAFRDHITVVSGLDHNAAVPFPEESSGQHTRAGGSFLTGVHIKRTEGVHNGISMDQIAARALGEQTQLGSLELALEATELVGACDPGYSCAYMNTMSWRGPTSPVPVERDPRAVFERLFGATESLDSAVRLSRMRKDHTILDSVARDIARLQPDLGPSDRSKIDDYLQSIRDVERRIQKAEDQGGRELPAFDKPFGIPDTFKEHIELMFDLQVLAYQTDITRVVTFMVGRESSNRAYPEIGVRDGHHSISHHGDNPDKLANLAKINAYHTTMFARFLEKLRSTPDGDGTLLDSVLIVYGSGMSDGNHHDPHDVPILLVGGAAGQLRGGLHHRYPAGTPLTSLHRAVLAKLGVRIDRLGEGSEAADYLTEI